MTSSLDEPSHERHSTWQFLPLPVPREQLVYKARGLAEHAPSNTNIQTAAGGVRQRGRPLVTVKSAIHRYLDPGETLAEVLFGLIMVLSITAGAEILSGSGVLDTHTLVAAAIGCNIAWGVIDAVLFVLGSMFYRSQRARFFRGLRTARSEAEALAAIQEEFGLEDEPLAVPPEDRTRLYRSILALSVHAAPARVRLLRRDFVSAFVVFVLVSVTAIPGVIPFLLLDDSYLALRVSNAVLILLLIVVGYWWAHYTDAPPWHGALIVLLLGVSMVAIAVILGG